MMQSELLFDPDTHTYTLRSGAVLPSITEITRFTHYDTAQTANVLLRDAAAERGKAVHELTALYDYGELSPDNIPPEYSGYLLGYMRFIRDYAPEWEYIEWPVHNGVAAGTIDRFGKVDLEDAIVDIKSGTSREKAGFQAQLTGYQWILRRPCKLYILHLAKDGTYKLVEYQRDMELFDACMKLHDATKKGKRQWNKA